MTQKLMTTAGNLNCAISSGVADAAQQNRWFLGVLYDCLCIGVRTSCYQQRWDFTPGRIMGIMPAVFYKGYDRVSTELLPDCDLGQIQFGYDTPYAVCLDYEPDHNRMYAWLVDEERPVFEGV